MIKPDVEALAAAGTLTAAGWYKDWPLWACRALDVLDADLVAATVAERQAWEAASVSKWDAPAYLGWHTTELARVADERGLRLGRLDRYAKADLDALAADEALAEQLHADRLLVGHQAAAHLEIRATDFRYLVAADLAVPHSHTSVQTTRYRWADVPLYRTGDALRDCPVIDWEAVRAVKPGEPSPLRHLARRPVDRAAAIRRWVAEYGDQHGIEVWAWFHPGAGRWEVGFERARGGPRVKDARAAIYNAAYKDSVAAGKGRPPNRDSDLPQPLPHHLHGDCRLQSGRSGRRRCSRYPGSRDPQVRGRRSAAWRLALQPEAARR